jgi:hypothetical protein
LIAGSTLSGGIGAELGGGDFLTGAAQGGIIAGANHFPSGAHLCTAVTGACLWRLPILRCTSQCICYARKISPHYIAN